MNTSFHPKMDQNRPVSWGFFVFFLLFSPARTEDQSVIQALVVFMDKLVPGTMQNTPNWGWNTSSDPCTSKWVGITCDKDNITVKKIVLEKLNLSGVLDFESVCKVSNLLVLSVSFNNVTGSLQQELSNCKRLTHLYLTGNQFSGNLPDSITGLPNVNRVDISNNGFTGQLPDISRLTSLLTFFAQNNQFTGPLPRFNYRQLDGFNVANNDLSGPIPDDTGRFDASSFAGNPRLCGKELAVQCPVKKNDKKSYLRDILIYSGYVVLVCIILVLVAILACKKRKKKHEDVKTRSPKKNGSDSGRSSGSKNSRVRSEFSTTSVESGGISSSMVVLSSPVVNGLRFEDLLRAPAELIGRGKHGSLYKVKPDNGVPVVVKRIRDWKISRDEFKKRLQKIVEIKHPNVLPVVAYYSSKQEKLLVYEFQQNGSLFRLLHVSQNGQMFSWGSRLSLASSIAGALAFMHHELQADLIPHGNIKSSNILLTDNMEPCLSEYGLMPIDHQDPDPNNNNRTAATFKDDVHAFGLVLLELLTGKPIQDNGTGLANWVSSILKEEWTIEVFDKALIIEGASEERMVVLLQVALKCINNSTPPPMAEVSAIISSLKEEEERSTTSSDP